MIVQALKITVWFRLVELARLRKRVGGRGRIENSEIKPKKRKERGLRLVEHSKFAKY